MFGLAKKLFGSANERFVRQYHERVEKINALEPQFEKLSDDELAGKTAEFRARLGQGASLDSLLAEAFATVREASRRVLGMRHFDVQMIGGMVLHEGRIAEMKTGEGKTLVATLPAYLNALPGKGVHLVTVNDYLAKRDAEWMGRLYGFLGMTTGTIVHEKDDDERKAAYACDITYGTNNEYGFDYLRDNMKYSREQMVQRPFVFALVDEVDSILIDEARTPLIISGPTEDNSALYVQIDKLMPLLTAKDDLIAPDPAVKREPGKASGPQHRYYDLDEKSRSVALTEEGVEHTEALLKERGLLPGEASLYDIGSINVLHHVNQALKAHTVFQRDVDYMVKDDKVVIIDEFTGRMMEGRRYSDGLHQALEAKESAIIQNENQTLASITFQNYFRLFPKLAGMTGTAMTEANEFADIYGLEVVEIPTNVDVARLDLDDEIYRTAEERYVAVIELVKECHAREQPVLVGTVSIEKSELLSRLLKAQKVPHQVLNARHHDKEAQIVAQAGRPGAVTIATNMAGRGTDIKLGGNAEMLLEEQLRGVTDEAKIASITRRVNAEVEVNKQTVMAAGGLYVIGTERHESRRIDNQLRGRSGRQGDPGGSKFFLSLQDDLMRIFGSERIDGMLVKLGMKEGEAIIHPWMNKAIERAQTKVEARNYDIRKNLLKYDDVMNDQRKVIYEQRIELMEDEDVSETIEDIRADVTKTLVLAHIPPKTYADLWDPEGLEKELFRVFGLHMPVKQWAAEEGIAEEEILERVEKETSAHFHAKDAEYGPEIMKTAKKRLLLQTLDQLWKDHLLSLDHLRSGINLRAYAQKDPLNEYKSEAFGLFERMLHSLREVVTERLSHMQVRMEAPIERLAEMPTMPKHMHEGRIDPASQPHGMMRPESGARIIQAVSGTVKPEERNPAVPESWGRVGRNEPCPCGSGQKFKYCHGQLT